MTGAWAIVWARSPVLVAKVSSPEYMAEIVCEPAVRLMIESLVAVPEPRATGGPKSTPSIRNCTVPVGMPNSGAAATVAVKVSESP